MRQQLQHGGDCIFTPPFPLLAIDTTFDACSAAIRLANKKNDATDVATFVYYGEMASGHAECLMDMIDNVLIQAGLEFKALNSLAVTVGPGSFTGTRVGIAAVRGLALATGVPVYTASSLAVIGRRAIAQLQDEAHTLNTSHIVVCADARRDRIYFQIFSHFDQPPITAPEISTLDDMARRIQEMGQCVLIIAPDVLKDNLVNALNFQAVEFQLGPQALPPSAEYLLDVQLELAAQPKPIYLRPPDAKVQTGKAIARRLPPEA